MNPSSYARQQHNRPWASNGYAEWTKGKTAYLSAVFTWHLHQAYQRAVWWRCAGYHVKAGGPAVALHPHFLADVADLTGQPNALAHHNPQATFTTRGCIRNCPFCAVPQIEGDLAELTNWQPQPIVCDNNLLAASHHHFNTVIDRLKPVPCIDFNQGLDARLLTKHHATRLAELDTKCIRLAWDNSRQEDTFLSAYQTLRQAGFPPNRIRVYVLIGFNDTPDDALYRLKAVQTLGSLPNPMRYQPLDSMQRNQYVAPNWTHRQLIRFTRYWSNLRYVGHVPFEEFGLVPSAAQPAAQDSLTRSFGA